MSSKTDIWQAEFKAKYRSLETILYLIILLLPFIMFFWTCPFVSDRTIGNDYVSCSISHQIELMFAIKTGTFPLYVPGYNGGLSSSGLSLGQIFHPISYIASLLPGYWCGKALEWNTFLRLLFLGLSHLLIFLFLIKLKLGKVIAFLLSTITIYNIQMLVLFRGASFEAWTGHLFLCTSIGFYCLKPTNLKGPLFIIASSYWLLNSGHPQMIYYGLLGAVLFTLIIPYLLADILPEKNVDFKHALKFWFRIGIFCFIGILLSSAFIISYYFDFIAENSARIGRGYAWADNYRDTLMGTINNFFYPLRSYNGFGGSSLYLVVLLVPILCLFRKIKIPRVIWIIYGLCFLTFLHMQGGRTPVHYFIWKYLPMASYFRVPGRIAMIMPMLLLLLMVWLVKIDNINIRLRNQNLRVAPSSILAISSLVIIIFYLCLPNSITTDIFRYCAAGIRKIPNWAFPFYIVLGVLTLASFALYMSAKRFRSFSGLFLCFFCCTQLLVILYYGTWIAHKADAPSYLEILSQKKEKLNSFLGVPGAGLYNKAVYRQCINSCLEPYLAKVYTKFINVEKNEEAYTLMAKGRNPDTIIIENYPNNLDFPTLSNPQRKHTDSVRLTYSSFNRLVFDAWATNSGFFELAYPDTGHWEAWVNKQNVPVFQANGYAMAVRVPAGYSQVEFRYWSSAQFWGVLISCFVLAMICFWGSFVALHKPFNVILGFAAISIVSVLFIFWYHSLYSGKNLNTRYSWQAEPAMNLNLAYGRRTKTSSHWVWHWPTYYSGGMVVDGDHTLNSGLLIEKIDPGSANPWWVVDLYHPTAIGGIKIYEGGYHPTAIGGMKKIYNGDYGRPVVINSRPLYIRFSDDGINWRKSYAISSFKKPLFIEFKTPEVARYVLIQATGVCRLSLDEVEIFPPKAD